MNEGFRFLSDMVLPIHIYGDPVLREPGEAVAGDSPEFQQLIDDMIETMQGASGIGLAAPQVGRSLRLFVLNLSAVRNEATEEELEEFGLPPEDEREAMVVINPEILSESENACEYEEGCLSIPGVTEMVTRAERVHMRYLDRDFGEREIEAGGLLARVMLHEYDHLEGVLFVDRLSTIRRRFMKRQLREIKKGQVEADYPLAEPVK
jgi:peptide deformylase